MRILIVEDDEDSRVLLATILESCGYTTDSATNGFEALSALERARPDMIVSDIMMPGMDGFALCRAVKSNPDLAAIPFLFYSATYTTPPDIQLAGELGATRFLIKPLDPGELIRQIQEIIPQSPATPLTPVPSMDMNSLDAKYAVAIARKLDKKVVELKNTKTQLDTSEEQLRRIQDNYRIAQHIARAGCWNWDIASDRFWWSDELYERLGVDSNHPADRALLLSRIAPDDRERFDRAMKLVGEQGIAFSLDHGFLGHGNITRTAHSEARAVEINTTTGRPERIVCAMRDITEQKQMEKDKNRLEASLRQSQKMEALGTLAGGIAHDFNNILNAVLAHAENLLIDCSEATTDHRKSLQEIITAGQRAAALVRQILTFSRQADNQPRTCVDLNTLVTEVLSFIRTSIPRHIKVDFHACDTVPRISADPSQLYQVILNLCLNACQAMRPDGGILKVSVYREQINACHAAIRAGVPIGAHVVLSVSDTGCGMDASTRERIFEPFFTTKSNDDGTGLGLAVVHGIVLSHNGHIQVDSEPGRGTTFTVYLPVLAA